MVDQLPRVASGVVGVVDHECARLAGEAGHERLDHLGRVVLVLGRRRRVGEPRPRHGLVEPRREQRSRDPFVLEPDLDPDRVPVIDELGAERRSSRSPRPPR